MRLAKIGRKSVGTSTGSSGKKKRMIISPVVRISIYRREWESPPRQQECKTSPAIGQASIEESV